MDGKLWCRQGDRVFCTAPNNVAVESEYYRLHRLSEEETKVVRRLCVDGRTHFHADLAEKLIAFLDHPYDILARLGTLFPGVDGTGLLSTVEVNYVEDLFALIEAKMCPILDKLRKRDFSSATCPNEAPWLAFFLSAQYFRTKSMEHRMLSVVSDDIRSRLDCDWKRVWSVMRVVLTCQVGASIHNNLERAGWTVLEAPTEIELVTSDQPLFNIKSKQVGRDGFVEEFALYFPITPEFAILCDLTSSSPVESTQILPPGNARHYNKRMAEEAFRQVFARRRAELDIQ